MFQRFASNCTRANLRPACRPERRARGGRAEGWGKSCVCSARCAALQKCASALAKRRTRRHSSHSSQLGRYFPTGLCLDFGWRTVQSTSVIREKRVPSYHARTLDTPIASILETMKRSAPSHSTRRHIKELIAEGKDATDDTPDASHHNHDLLAEHGRTSQSSRHLERSISRKP
jgi:hypothetical protein